MARTISLAVGHHVPFSFPKLFGTERTTLSADRGSITLRNIVRAVGDTVTMIAAAGRVGAAVEAHKAPNPSDLKVAGLEADAFARPRYRF